MNPEQLEHLRHSTAHLMAAAVLDLYPGTKNAIGPAIENGFYTDFDFGDVKISEKDLPKIEKKMREIGATWGPFVTQEVSVEQARRDFAHNPYKLELIEEFAQGGKTITENNPGNFLDLCRGGHLENPKKEIKHFKLLSIAGAYWRGDEKNKMLTRIYGTAFPTKDALEKYVWQLEEAKRRDHKKLGKELDLFVFSDLVGPGLPLWTPKGTLLRNILDEFVWKLRKARGYQRVTIPHITKKDLYETSGHWSKFQNELFKIQSREGHLFAMKPMNCPHHTQIFNHLPRSYREMPQRYAETTTCYRDEQTGELSGLSRVRAFTQDDAHVFCRKSQIEEEYTKIWDIVDIFYAAFGFKLKVRLSLHDPGNMSAYLGTPEMWKEAEDSIRGIAKKRNADYFEAVGEAAFYGPKIDFMAHDSLGRQWQVATIQLDINMPERFDLFCIDESGNKERIVMIHAAIMGSIDRFLSIIIEHLAGAFPVWLSPVQVRILPISDKFMGYAKQVEQLLAKQDIRVELDMGQKTIGYKIRESTLQKIPYMVIIGEKEMQQSKADTQKLNELYVSVRTREGKDEGLIPLSEFINTLQNQFEKYVS